MNISSVLIIRGSTQDHTALYEPSFLGADPWSIVAGPLENDIRKPRCSHEVAKPLGTRLWMQWTWDQ